MVELGLGNLAGPFMGVLKGLLIALPFVFLAVLFGLAMLYVRRQKIYNIDIDLLVQTAESIVRATDKAGIVRNGVEEKMVLRRRKVSVPIPSRDYWMQNEKGKFTITLFKYGETDYAPVSVKSIKKFFSTKKIEFTEEELKNMTEMKDVKALDVNKQMKAYIGDPKFEPIPSDSKSHHLMNARSLRMRNQQPKNFDKWAPMIQYGIVAVLIFLTLFYGFQFAQSNIDKAVKSNQACLSDSRSIIETAERICGDGSKRDYEDIEEVIPPPI